MVYVLFAVFAVVALVVGRIGYTRSALFVPVTRDPRERLHRQRVIRRGAVACHIVAAIMALGLVLQAAGALGHG